MDIITPDWHDVPANVKALSTLRTGGVSRAPYDDGMGAGGLNLGSHVGDDPLAVAENRARLQALLPAPPAWLNQVHGTAVVDAALAKDTPAADASIAVGPGAVCVIMTADCLPVLFCDTAGRVVGAAHAGWRGLAAGALENTVDRMRAAGAADIIAWLGPAIGPASFEVGEEVVQIFAEREPTARRAFAPLAGSSGKYLADIYQLARIALQRHAVSRVFGGGWCTMAERRFFSYRREQTTGRMATMIWLE